MNNKTFETIQQTIVRVETILEVDTSLSKREQNVLDIVLWFLKEVYENSTK